MRQRLPDFAGVALVDILANGVGMLIIIIVLSISARFAQEEKQLEQVDDVSVVLSRQLATSIVLNTLSAAPPARLHDYEKSPLDQNLDFQRIPILELHREFVRDYYSGRVFLRKELLLEQNRLDEFVAAFSPLQKRGIRVDIYDIRQFYLAMSILRTHGIDPRHWHFLSGGGMGVQDAGFCPGGTPGSECTGIGGGAGAEVLAQRDLDRLFADGSDARGEEEGDAEDGEGSGTGGEGQEEAPAVAAGGGAGGGEGEEGGEDAEETGAQWLPGESDLSNIAQGSAASLVRFPASGAIPQSADAPGAGSADSMAGQPLDSSHQDLMQSIGRSSTLQDNGQGSAVRPQKARFRRAVPEENERQRNRRNNGSPGEQTRRLDTLPPLRDILAILLGYMREVQELLDRGQSPLPLLQGFSDSMEEQLQNPPPVRAADEELILPLVEHFIAYWPDDSAPDVRQELRPQLSSAALILPPNTGVEELVLGGNEYQEKLPELPSPKPVRVRINLYPSVFRGLLQNLELHSVLLMPPEQQDPGQFRWRAVTYISPAFDDYVFGFVYAALDADGELLVQADANRVQVGQHFTRTVAPPREFDVRDWMTLFYALLVGALLLFLVPALAYWWRVRRPVPAH